MSDVFPPIWKARWKGRGRWTRFTVGPLAVSIYAKRSRSSSDRWFLAHSWAYLNDHGERRHVWTLRRWWRRRYPTKSATEVES